eukprot:4356745-Amphidinium_carterae.1
MFDVRSIPSLLDHKIAVCEVHCSPIVNLKIAMHYAALCEQEVATRNERPTEKIVVTNLSDQWVPGRIQMTTPGKGDAVSQYQPPPPKAGKKELRAFVSERKEQKIGSTSQWGQVGKLSCWVGWGSSTPSNGVAPMLALYGGLLGNLPMERQIGHPLEEFSEASLGFEPLVEDVPGVCCRRALASCACHGGAIYSRRTLSIGCQ